MDYDIAELSFNPRERGRKSYARDSHGFESAKHYFQDDSSDEEGTCSTDNSFTLSLGTSSQQRLVSEQLAMATLPSDTRSNKLSFYSPSPLKSNNQNITSPVHISANPKKRLTFEVDDENQKYCRDESISDSDGESDTMVEEALPGAHLASTANPSPKRSPGTRLGSKNTALKRSPGITRKSVTIKHDEKNKDHQRSSKTASFGGAVNRRNVKSFELGEFSDSSSSDSDEDIAAIKKSFFVRPVGTDTLMCLPKLSEYMRPKEMNIAVPREKNQSEVNHQRNAKRKVKDACDVETTKSKRRKSVPKRTVVEETTTSTEEEVSVGAVRTERNPKLTKTKGKKRTLPNKNKRAAAKKLPGSRLSSNSPMSDNSQKSFAFLRNTSNKIIDSIYISGGEEFDEEMVDKSLRRQKGRPSISFTSKGEEIRQTQSNVSKAQQAFDPFTDPTDAISQQNVKRRLRSDVISTDKCDHHSNDTEQHKKHMPTSEAENDKLTHEAKRESKKKEIAPSKQNENRLRKRSRSLNEVVANRNKDKHQKHVSKLVKESSEEEIVSKKRKRSSPHNEVDASEKSIGQGNEQEKSNEVSDQQKQSRPPTVLDANRNKGQVPNKRKASHAARGKKLVDATFGTGHVVMGKPVVEEEGVRRSSRAKVPAINRLLGEQLVYEASASGGMVFKGVIRPGSPSLHVSLQDVSNKATKHSKNSSATSSQSQSAKSAIAKESQSGYQSASSSERVAIKQKPKQRNKHSKNSSAAASQSQPGRNVAAKKKKSNYQESFSDSDAKKQKPKTLQHGKKSPKKLRHLESEPDEPEIISRSNSSGPSPVVVNPLAAMETGEHSGGPPVEQQNKSAVAATHRMPLPLSPRSKESFGNSLIKSMFQLDSSLATESVEIINDDGTVRPPVEVIKPLQSLRLCNADGLSPTPSDPFILAILTRQRAVNLGVVVLNKMGEKDEQFTADSSVYFFLISGEILITIGDLQLHPPVWARIFIPEGVSYSLKNLQHTPAILMYAVIKPNKDHGD